MENKRTVLLVHGFGGTPDDFGDLPEALEKLDMDIIAPVLPGQIDNRSPYDSEKHTARFYKKWINEKINEAFIKCGKKIILTGFSMGGTLSILRSDTQKVEKMVLLAPFLSLPLLNGFLSNVAKGIDDFIGSVPKPLKGKISDPEGYDKYEPGSMKVNLKAFNQLSGLASEAFERASEVEVETIIFHSKNDNVASYKKMIKAFENNRNVKIKKLERSDHILLYDYDRNEVIKNITEFIEK